jgi:hypothetical protein
LSNHSPTKKEEEEEEEKKKKKKKKKKYFCGSNSEQANRQSCDMTRFLKGNW